MISPRLMFILALCKPLHRTAVDSGLIILPNDSCALNSTNPTVTHFLSWCISFIEKLCRLSKPDILRCEKKYRCCGGVSNCQRFPVRRAQADDTSPVLNATY